MMVGEPPAAGAGGSLCRGTSLSGRYTVCGVLRDDGASILYAGRTTAFAGEPVMIKEVLPGGFVSAENRTNVQVRFQREVQVLQELRHPALPTVLDAFSEQSRHYLVMGYCPGETLETMLARRGRPFAEEDVVGWALEILSALGLMHRHAPPVIYRNLKPGNIVIDPWGMLRLLDFGLARFYTQGKRQDTAPIGPIGYAPPEQTTGTTDARSDLFALGVTMHHLLTNQHPALYAPGMLPPATCNPAVSSDLAAIIARAVEIDPGRRWSSAMEMELALRRHIVTLTARPRPRADEGAGSESDAGLVETGGRLVITAARLAGRRDEVMYHLRRLTWLTQRDLDSKLADLPTVVPLVEPYKSSLRVLKGLGLEGRPVWPLRGLHALDEQLAGQLQQHGRVAIDDPAACEDGLCLCRHCHFGWMLDQPGDAPPEACASCGRVGWNKIMLLRCRWCGHESEESGSMACPCCGLIAPRELPAVSVTAHM